EMESSITGHRYAARRFHSAAIVVQSIYPSNRLSRLVGIQGKGQGRDLIQISLERQMGTLGTNVCYREHRFTSNFTLQVQMPLLYIGPYRLVRNRRYVKGKK